MHYLRLVHSSSPSRALGMPALPAFFCSWLNLLSCGNVSLWHEGFPVFPDQFPAFLAASFVGVRRVSRTFLRLIAAPLFFHSLERGSRWAPGGGGAFPLPPPLSALPLARFTTLPPVFCWLFCDSRTLDRLRLLPHSPLPCCAFSPLAPCVVPARWLSSVVLGIASWELRGGWSRAFALALLPLAPP